MGIAQKVDRVAVAVAAATRQQAVRVAMVGRMAEVAEVEQGALQQVEQAAMVETALPTSGHGR